MGYQVLSTIFVQVLLLEVVAQVKIYPESKATANVNAMLTFRCRYTGNTDLLLCSFKRNNTQIVTLLYPECSFNSSTYNYSCKGRKECSASIVSTSIEENGVKWKCEVRTITGSSYIQSPETEVSIAVPITSVTMVKPNSSLVTVNENTAFKFKCQTSGGLPAASITWYKDSGTSGNFNDDLAITSNIESTETPTHSLIEVTSMLMYSPSRNENGWSIYCTANNVDGQTPVVSRKPLLYVRYPPGSPVITGFTNGSEYRVIENNQGQLSCTVTEGNPAPILKWNCINSGVPQTSSTGIVTKLHTWIAQQGQDRTCTCKSSYYSGESSVSIKIEILYPPTAPTFRINSTLVSGQVKVIRNNHLSVSCISSGNPPPSFTWTFPDMTSTNSQELSVSNVQNNSKYTCNVQNSMDPSDGAAVPGSSTSFIAVLILYHPSIPILNYWNTSGPEISTKELDVIRGDTIKVACTSNGEPVPTYDWDNQRNNRILTINNITTDGSSVCTARNVMQETVGQTLTRSATASLKINVLYPPSVMTLVYHGKDGSNITINKTLSIKEGNPFTVTCSSESKPQSSYTWTGNVSSVSATLKVDSVVRSKTGTITCKVQNVMSRTFANPEKTKVGKTSGSFNLHVLYPPEIGNLNNKSVAEGSQVQVSCPVTVGYPSQTTFEWIRDGAVWNRTQTFTIDKTSRTDAMTYTCKVSNRMQQTGEQPVSQPDTKSFYLNVWYSASVKEFFISGHEGEKNVVVNENDPVPFKCNVDSNPGSEISVYYQENVIKSSPDTKSLAYTILSAKCTDRGDYSCIGFNKYNENHSLQLLSLLVRCYPRPSPSVTLKQNVTSAQHKPAVLTFTTLAYPEPNNDDFRWYRLDSNVWQLLSNSEVFEIETSNMQTNLTIKDVNRTYYGMYKLNISNEVGNYSQLFYLEPEDIPDPPTEFRHVAELVTKTSVTLQWKPGFDNGPDQTFVLRYKKVSDNDWTSVYVPDTGEELMNYNITKLSSGTDYEVVLQAFNKLGNSSATETLNVKTIDISTQPPGLNLGLILGVMFGVVAILVLSFVGFLLARKLRNGKAKEKREVELNGRRMDDPNEDSSDDEVVTENAMYESASNVGQKRLVDDNVYAKPQKKPVANADVYAVVNKTKKQDKKKKQKSHQKKDNIGDIYENAPDTAVSKEKTYANSAYDENPYEAPDQASVKRPKKNADGLIYADLTFNDQPKGQKKLVIHGLDSMTEYVEVDFTKKADPLPDSDTEDQK